MAGTSVLKLKVDDKEYNASLKQAQQGMQHLEQALKGADKSFKQVDKSVVDYVRGIGQMEAQSKTARGRINEMSNAFIELSLKYKKMSDEVKSSDVGKALTASLDQLKVRITDAKAQLSDVTAELGEIGQAGVDLKGVMGQLGGQLGINTDLIRGLSAGTIGATAAIGAMVTTTLAAVKAFVDYNTELAQQGQITEVTTGIKGPQADRMTDAASSIAKVYGTDFREVINAANTLMTQFGESGESAMQLIRDGMQGMIQGDGPKLLSMIQQFAPSFRDAGISASQLVAIIHNSEGGIFTDQNMQAIVMGIRNIRLMTKQTSDALGKLGIDGQEMTRKLNDGSMTIFEAMRQVSSAIDQTGGSTQAAGEVMQAVFGRQATMAGSKLGEAIATLNTNLEETKMQTGELGQSYAQLEQANERLNIAIRECFGYDGWQKMATGIKTDLTTALSDVLTIVGDIKNSIVGDIAGTIFDAMTKSLQTAIVAGRTLLALLNKVAGYTPTGTGGSGADAGGALATAANAAGTAAGTTAGMGTAANAAGTTAGTAGRGTTPAQQAEKAVEGARQKYADALLLASKELEAGVITEAEYKKRLLSGQQRLYDAYGQAYQTYADPAYKEAQKKAADEVVKLGGEVKVLAEHQEASKKAAQELEQAQKRLADAELKLAEAQATGSATAVYKAQQALERRREELEAMIAAAGTGTAANAAGTAAGIAAGTSGRGTTANAAGTAAAERTTAASAAGTAAAGTAGMAAGQVTVEVTADTREALEAIRGIEGIKIEQKEVEVTADAEDARTAVQGLEDAEIGPKTVEVTADTLEALEALSKVEGVHLDPKTVKVTTVVSDTSKAMLDGLKQSVQAEIKMDQMKVDEETLHTLLKTALQNGLDSVTVDYGALQQRIVQGIDIPDEDWQALVDEINEKLKEMDLEPIKINFDTGKPTDDAKKVIDSWNAAGSAIRAVGSAMSSIEDPAAKVMGIIAQAIATIALSYAQASAMAAKNPANAGWGWIAFAAAGAATMISSIAAVKNATAGSYAEGGIVPGHSYSGDLLTANVNSGELILNMAQQENIAQLLTGRGEEQGGVDVQPYVMGEQIVLGVNNTLGRMGRGELVTTATLRRYGLIK